MLIKLSLFSLGIALLLFAFWLQGTLRQQRAVKDVSIGNVISITTSKGPIDIPVELAVTMDERISGLSDRISLQQGSGMLFVWEKNVPSSFVMRRMNFPLDIIFIEGRGEGVGEIIHIAVNLPKCPNSMIGCATASSPKAVQYVLEVNGGFAAELGISVGDAVQIAVSGEK